MANPTDLQPGDVITYETSNLCSAPTGIFSHYAHDELSTQRKIFATFRQLNGRWSAWTTWIEENRTAPHPGDHDAIRADYTAHILLNRLKGD